MRFKSMFQTLVLILIVVGLTACEREESELQPAEFPDEPLVFTDTFIGVDYQSFGDSKLDALEIDDRNAVDGTASMKITVPGEGDPTGTYAGAALVAGIGRDLSQYNALTFWARASMNATLNNVGFGNDNAGTSQYVTEVRDLKLTTAWQKYTVPIPLAAKLERERGLFYFADGNEEGVGYSLWIDNVMYEKVGTIAHPRLAAVSTEVTVEAGENVYSGVEGVTFNVNGADRTVYADPNYFTFSSANETIATVSADGRVTGVAIGTTEITVELGDKFAETLTVNVIPASPKPTEPAPTPTVDPADVISLFSNAYDDVLVDAWNTYWQYSTAETEDVQVDGNDMKKYTELNFVGIEFATQPINASEMTHFHIDIWTPDPTAAPAAFKVQLVDFGADGAFDGGDDSSHELTFTAPILATESWVSLDIPLSDFTGLTGRQNIAQLVLSGDLPTVYVDNVYFHAGEGGGGGGDTEPTTAAPTPTLAPGDVVSLFSNAYSNATVDTWSADWDNAELADIQINGNDTKHYSSLVFAGIEFTSQTIDATDMTHFHLNLWTPDATDAPANLRIKLVDFGADGAFDGGDDVEHEITLDATTTPGLATGSWLDLAIPLSDFTGLTTQGHLAQLILSSDALNTIYVDNVLFYTDDGSGGGDEYIVDFESGGVGADWSWTVFENGDNPAIELVSNPNMSGANTSATVAQFNVRDAGADWAGCETRDIGEFTFDAENSTVTIMVHKSVVSNVHIKFEGFGPPVEKMVSNTVTGAWEELTYDFSDAIGNRYNKLVIFPDFASRDQDHTVYFDNIQVPEGTIAPPPDEPSEAAPTPTLPAGDVVSMFSNAYTNVPVDTWSASWDAADLEDIQINSNDTKKYTNLSFAGVEFTSQTIDASSMTHFHLHLWTPDATDPPANIRIKLVDFGADGSFEGGDDVEHEITLDATTTPGLATGSWLSLDIPLSEFTGLTTQGHLAQLIISSDYLSTIYVDNVLFHD